MSNDNTTLLTGRTFDALGELLVMGFVLSVLILVVGNALIALLQLWSRQVAVYVAAFACLPLVAVVGFLSVILVKRLIIALEVATNWDLNRDGQVGRQDVRLIPVYKGGSEPSVDGVEPRDLRAFIRTIVSTGDWTQDTWRGQQMPSGRKTDNVYYDKLVTPLVKAGFIVKRGSRKTGHLVCRDADVILDRLGL